MNEGEYLYRVFGKIDLPDTGKPKLSVDREDLLRLCELVLSAHQRWEYGCSLAIPLTKAASIAAKLIEDSGREAKPNE